VRWLVFLFAVNVCFAVWQWSGMRTIKNVPAYTLDKGVQTLRLAESGRGCFLIGPLAEQARAEELDGRLKALGLYSELIQKQTEKAPRYWVYYGPLPDYEMALEQSRKFRAEGLDNFIITQESLYGAVSLGVFENIDSARKMQALVQRKGYATSIRNIFKFDSAWWVEVLVPNEPEKSNEISRIVGGFGLAPELREFFCKTVAS